MLKGVVRQVRRQPVAFVALFFALGGGAMAATNVIKSGDTIGSGDLAGSTYGAPMIHSGAVTNADLSNPSLTVSPGTGLTGGGSIALGGSGTLGVDPTAVQSRVSGTCSSGQAISSVDQDGTVTCAGTKVMAGAVDFFGTPQSGSGFTVAHTSTGHYILSFPAGTWSDGSTPALTLTALGPPAILSVEGTVSANGAEHFIIAASDGASPVDSGFEFIAAQT